MDSKSLREQVFATAAKLKEMEIGNPDAGGNPEFQSEMTALKEQLTAQAEQFKQALKVERTAARQAMTEQVEKANAQVQEKLRQQTELKAKLDQDSADRREGVKESLAKTKAERDAILEKKRARLNQRRKPPVATTPSPAPATPPKDGMHWSTFLGSSSEVTDEKPIENQSVSDPPSPEKSGMSWTSYLAEPGDESAPPAKPTEEKPKRSSWKDFASE